MPRTYSMTDKRKWLDAFERGETEASIARQQRPSCDVRTVRKGIEQARQQRAAQDARAQLTVEALRGHQESLLSIVREVLGALTLPAHGLQVPAEIGDDPSPILLPAARVEYRHSKEWTLTFHCEEKPEWKLLQEHLRRDKMWKSISQWKKAIVAHLKARVVLKTKAVDLLTERTGYQMMGKNGIPPFISDSAADLLYRVTLGPILGTPDGTDFQSNITADADSAEVAIGGTTLATVPKGEEQDCKTHILLARGDLSASEEASQVGETYEAAKEQTDKAREAVEEICLLGLVPGECRICKRLLGM